MILACHDVSKAFGEHVIIQNGSFHIEDHEKAALVGINGAGKSTLLKMIVGDLTADGGTITLTKDTWLSVPASGAGIRQYNLRRSTFSQGRCHCYGITDPRD